MMVVEEIPSVSFYRKIRHYLNKRQPVSKKQALAWYLNVPLHEVRELTFPDFAYMINGYEYLVLTDEERFQVVKEILENNLVSYRDILFSFIPALKEGVFLDNSFELVNFVDKVVGFNKFVDKVLDLYGYSFFLGMEIRILYRGREYFAYREVG